MLIIFLSLIEGSSWKAMVHKRRKKFTKSRIHLKTHPRTHLRETIDRLHLSRLVDKTNDAKDSSPLGKGHKRKNGSVIFLARNIKKVKAFLHVPISKERENVITPRKNNKFLHSSCSVSGNKITCQQKKLTQISRERENVITPRNNNKFLHNSCSIIGNKETCQQEKRTQLNERCKFKADTVRGNSKAKTFDSGFYELEMNDLTDDEEILPELSLQSTRKRGYPEKPSSNTLTSKHELSAKKGRYSGMEKRKDSAIAFEENSDSSQEKDVKSNKIVFKPLFSKHCGGTWRQIVDEN